MSIRGQFRGEFDPWLYAEAHGIAVQYSHQLRPGRLGEWNAAQRLIVLAHGMSAIQETSVLTHELGHAHLQHAGCLPAQERAADSWAADRLVDPERYAAAEEIYGQDLCSIADEIGVMDWAVVAWRQNETERRRWAAYFEGDLIA